jgi:S1-C subfamily serine protease
MREISYSRHSVAALLVLITAIACGGGSQAIPDVEATVQARLGEERAAEATVEARAQVLAKAIVESTVEAILSSTPIPTTTANPTPTRTPTPAPTAKPSPAPTETPSPEPSPVHTWLPTAVPPTSTPIAGEFVTATVTPLPVILGPVNTTNRAANLVQRLRPSVVKIDTDLGVIGSGVIYDAEGLVLTNNHVIDGATSVIVSIHAVEGESPTRFPARVVGTDAQRDLAVLKIQGDGFVSASLGTWDDVAVGEVVLALGFPLGLEGDLTVTQGIVSAKRVDSQVKYIQHQAPINPGSSGGPLVSEEGAVVGINTLILRQLGDTPLEGLNFAVAIDEALAVLEAMERGDTIRADTQPRVVTNEVYGYAVTLPEGWVVVIEEESVTYIASSKTGAFFAIEIDETQDWSSGQEWAEFWYELGVEGLTNYQLVDSQFEEVDGFEVWLIEETYQREGDSFLSHGIESFTFGFGAGIRFYFEAPDEAWEISLPDFEEIIDSIR